MKKSLMMMAAAAALVSAPAFARVNLDIGINVAPPVEQVEYVPVAPAPNMVWMPGYWTWAHGRYVWVGGRYVAERPGYYWVSDEWVRYDRGWRRNPGHWERQRFYDHNRDWDDRGPGPGNHDWHDDHHDNGRHRGWDH